ncbi:hypothetical protein PoB_002936200 [Plakobranchus ocellatus]|uniref:Uncharacterized protein n=1 Tax=Plakobranchus ocellatus TaxID=259542 RepID=A0AAV4A6G5_9GAST|nr:hypothetical protein PoB_002936200 [Plakobranchus ocellatus]
MGTKWTEMTALVWPRAGKVGWSAWVDSLFTDVRSLYDSRHNYNHNNNSSSSTTNNNSSSSSNNTNFVGQSSLVVNPIRMFLVRIVLNALQCYSAIAVKDRDAGNSLDLFQRYNAVAIKGLDAGNSLERLQRYSVVGHFE